MFVILICVFIFHRVKEVASMEGGNKVPHYQACWIQDSQPKASQQPAPQHPASLSQAHQHQTQKLQKMVIIIL